VKLTLRNPSAITKAVGRKPRINTLGQLQDRSQIAELNLARRTLDPTTIAEECAVDIVLRAIDQSRAAIQYDTREPFKLKRTERNNDRAGADDIRPAYAYGMLPNLTEAVAVIEELKEFTDVLTKTLLSLTEMLDTPDFGDEMDQLDAEWVLREAEDFRQSLETVESLSHTIPGSLSNRAKMRRRTPPTPEKIRELQDQYDKQN
jgi:hypothetical protein